MNALTDQTIQNVLQELHTLDDASAEQIAQTAEQLEAMSYEPILLTDTPDFLRMTSEDLSAHVQDLVSNHRNELTEQHLSLLVYHFKLLRRLRRDEPEAWDEVNELMEDD